MQTWIIIGNQRVPYSQYLRDLERQGVIRQLPLSNSSSYARCPSCLAPGTFNPYSGDCSSCGHKGGDEFD